MTPPRRWPNAADDARIEAIAQAKKILLQMSPMKEAVGEGKTVSSLELIVRLDRISDAANRIIQELVTVGPHKFAD